MTRVRWLLTRDGWHARAGTYQLAVVSAQRDTWTWLALGTSHTVRSGVRCASVSEAKRRATKAARALAKAGLR